MTEFTLWFLIITIVLISFTLLMFGLSIIPWCFRHTQDQLYYTASWSRMAIPEHDSFVVSVPPIPPYFFESGVSYDYDSFTESI